LVPALWRLEVAKQLDRRRPPGGIDVVFRNAALADLALLDIATDPDTDADGWTTTLHLAECFRLTLYDAVYVELAHRRSLPLASLDEELRAAARTLGVPVLGTAARADDQCVSDGKTPGLLAPRPPYPIEPVARAA
jgi:predicted nucleic acid-binding protein